MKRWFVRVGKDPVVELAHLQASHFNDEYVVSHTQKAVYVRAADELGAWVRAQELLEKEQRR